MRTVTPSVGRCSHVPQQCTVTTVLTRPHFSLQCYSAELSSDDAVFERIKHDTTAVLVLQQFSGFVLVLKVRDGQDE